MNTSGEKAKPELLQEVVHIFEVSNALPVSVYWRFPLIWRAWIYVNNSCKRNNLISILCHLIGTISWISSTLFHLQSVEVFWCGTVMSPNCKYSYGHGEIRNKAIWKRWIFEWISWVPFPAHWLSVMLVEAFAEYLPYFSLASWMSVVPKSPIFLKLLTRQLWTVPSKTETAIRVNAKLEFTPQGKQRNKLSL